MPRTSNVGEARREQILNAALRVFAEKGFARASNRDVARETGITPGLIYYYFENKEALLRTILEERSPMQTIAQISPEMLKQPPEVLLPALITWLLSVVVGVPVVSDTVGESLNEHWQQLKQRTVR